MNAIRLKMTSWSAPTMQGDSEQVQLNAVYAETGINKEWSNYTPCAQLTATIDNPGAQQFIQAGKEYIVEIREAQPGE
jgi:hypothetical protein